MHMIEILLSFVDYQLYLVLSSCELGLRFVSVRREKPFFVGCLSICRERSWHKFLEDVQHSWEDSINISKAVFCLFSSEQQ